MSTKRPLPSVPTEGEFQDSGKFSDTLTMVKTVSVLGVVNLT